MEANDDAVKTVSTAVTAGMSSAAGKANLKSLKAAERWAKDKEFLAEVIKDLEANHSDRKQIDSKLREMRQAPGWDVTKDNPESKALTEKLKLVVLSKESVQQRVQEHFSKGSSKGTSDSKPKGDSILPDGFAQGTAAKCKDFQTNILNYQQNKLSEHFATFAWSRFMFDSYDPTTGAYPSYKGEIEEAVLNEFNRQSVNLYEVICTDMKATIHSKIHNHFTYGKTNGLRGRVEDQDGVGAMHALMCCYKPVNTEYSNDIIDQLITQWQQFCSGNPTSVVEKHRLMTNKAEKECLDLPWELYGSKIVTLLSDRHYTLAHHLSKYGPQGKECMELVNKQDSVDMINKMFADIELAVMQIEAAPQAGGSNRELTLVCTKCELKCVFCHTLVCTLVCTHNVYTSVYSSDIARVHKCVYTKVCILTCG